MVVIQGPVYTVQFELCPYTHSGQPTGADPGILKGGSRGIKKRGPITQFVLEIYKIFSKRGGGGPWTPPWPIFLVRV